MKDIIPVLTVFLCLLAGSGHAAGADAEAELRFARWIHGGLLDAAAPMEERRKLAAELEALAQDDAEPDMLYLLGSLYRQDPAHSSSPFAQDLDRARGLLSRAALHGKIPAMAKLSTIELQAGNKFDANVWAQLYFHYAKDQAQADPRWSSGFAASILHNALDGFPAADIDAVSASVGAMIGQYDKQIREGLAHQADARALDRFHDARPGKRLLLNAEDTRGRRLDSGMAEYVVEFAADGSVGEVWTIDAWPNPRLARILRNIALGYRVEPAVAGEVAGKLSVLPLSFEDGRYSVRDAANTH
jgi:hypothetical protein